MTRCFTESFSNSLLPYECYLDQGSIEGSITTMKLAGQYLPEGIADPKLVRPQDTFISMDQDSLVGGSSTRVVVDRVQAVMDIGFT